jgi:drug/metabolite transporter (DMT)-like permease
VNRWRRITGWLTVLVVGVGLVGLGVYFGRIGLDRADKTASVIGAFSGFAGLALAAYGIVLARRDPPTPPSQGTDGAGHSVSNSLIGRDNIQIGNAGRDVNIRRD